MRIISALFLLGCALLLAFGAAPSPPPPAIDIASRLELMVDDFLVERIEGESSFRLHSPTHRGEPDGASGPRGDAPPRIRAR